MGEELKFTMYEQARIDPTAVPQVIAMYPEEMKFRVEANPYFLYTPRNLRAKGRETVLEKAGEILQKMQVLVKEESGL